MGTKEEIALSIVTAVVAKLAPKVAKMTSDKLKEFVDRILQNNPTLRGQIDIDDLTKKIRATTSQVGHIAYNEETLARYLEIPIPDLATITPENLDLEMLYNHVKLEGEFEEWLQEWSYEVEVGSEKLTGLRGIEYIPDIYGSLNTLHGKFEVCISFVCDSPPDEDRVFALLGKIEAYAEAKKSFSYGDIFAIVTPYSRGFTQGAINAIALQNEQENYSVISLNGGDIHAFESAQTPKDRLEDFQDKVSQAEEESRRSKIKRMTRESGEDIR